MIEQYVLFGIAIAVIMAIIALMISLEDFDGFPHLSVVLVAAIVCLFIPIKSIERYPSQCVTIIRQGDTPRVICEGVYNVFLITDSITIKALDEMVPHLLVKKHIIGIESHYKIEFTRKDLCK